MHKLLDFRLHELVFDAKIDLPTTPSAVSSNWPFFQLMGAWMAQRKSTLMVFLAQGMMDLTGPRPSKRLRTHPDRTFVLGASAGPNTRRTPLHLPYAGTLAIRADKFGTVPVRKAKIGFRLGSMDTGSQQSFWPVAPCTCHSSYKRLDTASAGCGRPMLKCWLPLLLTCCDVRAK